MADTDGHFTDCPAWWGRDTQPPGPCTCRHRLRADRERLAAALRVILDEIDSTHADDPNSAEAPRYLVDYIWITRSLRDAAEGALTDVFGEVPDGTD